MMRGVEKGCIGNEWVKSPTNLCVFDENDFAERFRVCKYGFRQVFQGNFISKIK